MKKRHHTLGLVLALCCAALCGPAPGNAAEPLRIGGGSAPMENIFKRVKARFEEKTGIKLELIERGPIDAYVDLLADKVDVASAGMMYRDWASKVDPSVVAQMERRQNDPQVRFIGNDYVTLYSHPGVTVPELSYEQVKRIFNGEITNWREVGGPDLPITVILGRKVAGLMSEFQKRVLVGGDFAPKAVYVDTAREMKDKVKATPGAVSIGTLAQIQDQTIHPIAYPAPERYIHMIWKSDSPRKADIETLYKFLTSAEAKKYTLAYFARPSKKQKTRPRRQR